jgi:predicted Zn-dependent protease
MSVTDDATLAQVGATPLFFRAKVDDEGVPTRPVSLVERGRLKTLLVSRSPVRGVPASTGSQHGGPAPSNLIVTASEALEASALKAELLKLVQLRGRDYGVIVRRLGNLQFKADRQMMISSGGRDGVRVESAILAYRVFPDGREELLRNVEFGGMTPQLFKDIVAVGREPFVHTIPIRPATLMATGMPVVSLVVPALLFEEVTLKKPSGEIPKPQLAKHPYFDR